MPQKSVGHMTWRLLRTNKNNQNSCVSFILFTNTICNWIGVTGSHDMEDIENTAIILC